MNLSVCVLIHSFDGYAWLWPGQRLAFAVHWYEDVPIFFGTDIPNETTVHVGEMIHSGPGEWSDRLTTLLHKLPFDYILYMQEDHWPTKRPPISECMNLVLKYDLLRLQISTVNHFYTLSGDEKLLYFHPSSKYLVSHQPSIWKKSFFIECLKSGESPWINEYEGTKRLNNKPEIEKKIAIYPYDWYKHKCLKGKLID